MKDKNNQHKLKNEKETDGKIAATSTAKSSYVCMYIKYVCKSSYKSISKNNDQTER